MKLCLGLCSATAVVYLTCLSCGALCVVVPDDDDIGFRFGLACAAWNAGCVFRYDEGSSGIIGVGSDSSCTGAFANSLSAAVSEVLRECSCGRLWWWPLVMHRASAPLSHEDPHTVHHLQIPMTVAGPAATRYLCWGSNSATQDSHMV